MGGKKIGSIVCLLTTLFLLTSCGKSFGKKDLTFYHYDIDNKEIYEEIVKEYTQDKKFDIEVRVMPEENYFDIFEKESKLPDVFLIPESGLEKILENAKVISNFANLKNLRGKEELNKSPFAQLGITEGRLRDKVFAIPYGYSIPVVYYNKDIFELHKLTEPVNLGDFMRIYSILNSNNIDPLGIDVKDELWNIGDLTNGILINSGDVKNLFNKEGNLNTGFQDVYGLLYSIRDKMPSKEDRPRSYYNLLNNFTNGQNSMIVATTDDIGFIENSNINYGFFPIPGYEGNDKKVLKLASMLSVSKKTKRKKEAKKFVSYLLSQEVQEKLTIVLEGYPICLDNKILSEDLDEIFKLTGEGDLIPSLFQLIPREERNIYLKNIDGIFLDEFLDVNIFVEDLELELKEQNK